MFAPFLKSWLANIAQTIITFFYFCRHSFVECWQFVLSWYNTFLLWKSRENFLHKVACFVFHTSDLFLFFVENCKDIETFFYILWWLAEVEGFFQWCVLFHAYSYRMWVSIVVCTHEFIHSVVHGIFTVYTRIKNFCSLVLLFEGVKMCNIAIVCEYRAYCCCYLRRSATLYAFISWYAVEILCIHF